MFKVGPRFHSLPDFFQKTDRRDLPNAFVARIPVVTAGLGDLWGIPTGRHVIQCYTFRLAQMSSRDVPFSLRLHRVLLGTTPTRQGTEAGPLFMDIMQNNEAD